MDKITMSGILAASKYWWPKTKWQLLVYLSVSAAVWGIASFFATNPFTTVLSSMVSGLTVYLAIFAPVIFALGKGEMYNLTLPVSRRSMALYMMLWGVVLMPVAALLPQQVLEWLVFNPKAVVLDYVNQDAGTDISQSVTNIMQNYTYLYVVASSITCLWVVMATHKHRILKGIGAAYGVNIAFSLVLSVISIFTGMVHAIEIAKNGAAASPDEIKAQMVPKIIEAVTLGTYVMTPILIIYSVVALVMAWRSICNRTL